MSVNSQFIYIGKSWSNKFYNFKYGWSKIIDRTVIIVCSNKSSLLTINSLPLAVGGKVNGYEPLGNSVTTASQL